MGVNIESGEIKTYRMPLVPEETHFHSLLYGAAIDVAAKRVWWAQLYGFVGAFDTENHSVDRVIPFARGEGPRRLAIQDDGILWVPLFGSGQLAKSIPAKALEIARYDIPDPGAAPYGVTLDKRRNAIWPRRRIPIASTASILRMKPGVIIRCRAAKRTSA